MDIHAAGIAYTLVRQIPVVEFKDGIVMVTGHEWGLCATPAIFTGFVFASMRSIEQWQREQTAQLLPLCRACEKRDH